ncbi:MAG: hypothetical protein ABIC04_03720 [Nanoarchaeota archaeon]
MELLKEELGDNLISIVKFGSEMDKLLFVINKIDFETLNQIKPVFIRKRKKGDSVPLVFTREELLEGADVFPLEFLDIKHPHKTIYGEELINKINFQKKHVRRQLEFELRSKLIHLRENYIWIKKDKDLIELLNSAIPSLIPLFYGLLFLKNEKAPTKPGSLFNAVSKKYNIDLKVLLKIKGLKKEKTDELNNYVKELMKVLNLLAGIVDKIRAE